MTSLPRAPEVAPRCGTPRASRRSRWRSGALIAVHLLVLAHIAHYQITGSSLSPLEPSEAMQTLELGYLNAGFLLLVALILATLVVGRFFCGWACHVVAYQDLCAWLLGRLGLRPRPVRSRLLAVVPFGAAFYMFAWPTLLRHLATDDTTPAWAWHLQTASFWETFPGPGIALLTLAVDGFLVVWLLGAKGFCTYGCPYGALFGVADRITPGRIVVNEDCEGCGHCSATCTSNVDVRGEVLRFGQVVDPGCMKCTDCVSVCPKGALSFQFAKPSWFSRNKQRRPRRQWDFSWGEELGLAATFLIGLYAWRGLYGQVPFLLAIGLAVLGAVGLQAGLRAWRQPNFQWQQHVLRRNGRWTRPGMLAATVLVAGASLVLHSMIVQFSTRQGTRLFEQAQQAALDQQARPAQLLHAAQPVDPAKLASAAGTKARSQAFDHLQRASRLGLLRNHEVDNMLAILYVERREWPEAETHIRLALEVSPSMQRWQILYTVCAAQRKALAAREALRAILAQKPADAWALRRLDAMQRRGVIPNE